MKNSTDHNPHYIGVTGIKFREHGKQAVAIAKAEGLGEDTIRGMIGVISGPDTFNPAWPNMSSKPHRMPWKAETVGDILVAVQDPAIIPMIHMEVEKDGPDFGTNTWEKRDGNMSGTYALEALTWLQHHFEITPAIQINGVASAADIQKLAQITLVVIQMRNEIINNPPREVIPYLQDATKGVQGRIKILLDPSAGVGAQFDPEAAIGWEEIIRTEVPDCNNFGYAGGLRPNKESEEKIAALIAARARRFGGDGRDVSVDVETGVILPGREMNEPLIAETVDTRPGGLYQQYLEHMMRAYGWKK